MSKRETGSSSPHTYDYFCDLVIKLQTDGMSPSDFMEIGACLIRHAYDGADDKDAAAHNLAHVLKTLRTQCGMDTQ